MIDSEKLLQKFFLRIPDHLVAIDGLLGFYKLNIHKGVPRN